MTGRSAAKETYASRGEFYPDAAVLLDALLPNQGLYPARRRPWQRVVARALVHRLPGHIGAPITLAARYRGPVTALWSFDEQPHTGDPLSPGAAPAAIRDALLTEDRDAFDAAYQRALATAREDLDLTDLFRCLEHWRRLALLQRDPERFASIARRAAERLTGTLTPRDEPLADTRRRAGMQGAVYDVTTDAKSQSQIGALPLHALASFAEARAVLEVAPWNSASINDRDRDAPVRTLTFGPTKHGMITYLILERDRRVDILDVLWID